MKILIADDSHAVFERLVELLAPLSDMEITGHTTDVPGTLRGFTEGHPDVVILDLHMPGGNGIEVLKNIKRTNPETAVVVLTSFAYPQYRVICRSLGADFFLDKSVEFDKLPGLLRELAEKLGVASGASLGGAETRLATVSSSKDPGGGKISDPTKG